MKTVPWEIIMIGLSLSFCVRDLATNKVAMAEVEKIITGTRVRSWRRMKFLIRLYLDSYWHTHPQECERVVRQLIANTKRSVRGQEPQGPVIHQPRLKNGGRSPHLVGPAGGLRFWVNTEDEVTWC